MADQPRAADVFRHRVETARPLTAQELRVLIKMGFAELAVRMAAGTCPRCGLNKLSATHADLCERAKPKPAPPQPRQPWQPRGPRSRR